MHTRLANLRQGLQSVPSHIGNVVGGVDDVIQEKIRYLLGERDGKWDGDGLVQLAKATYGNAMHADRHMLNESIANGSPSWQKPVYLLGTRGLQAGAVTAAGAGLVNLTHALQNQFGGPADRPSPNELISIS